MTNSSQLPSSASTFAPAVDSSPIDINDPSVKLALTIARAAEDRKGADIVILRVTDISPLADYFVIVTGFSKVQVRAIARAIEDKVEEDLQRTPAHIEGQTDGTWVLQDYGDVIVHTMLPHEREYYSLEAFWGHAEQVNLAALAG